MEEAQTIAVVGHSNKPHRDSYRVAQYLRSAGYIVHPVNPAVDEIDGQRCYRALSTKKQEKDSPPLKKSFLFDFLALRQMATQSVLSMTLFPLWTPQLYGVGHKVMSLLDVKIKTERTVNTSGIRMLM
ncbi:CoA-binding protein [Synechococcus sp. PCC 7336]|uniref:CoA-binding protein n=1 Tax=Synechococcus sp. PCC 7336 TaxID=195250 RepID=UPI000348DC4C|nr:CoA-binding protein [Synechococcus sp. PCC 7336]